MSEDLSDRFPRGHAVTLAQLEADLHPTLADLRQTEPVSWLPALNGWLVTGRAEALHVMRDAEGFTVDDPRFSTGQVVGPSMLSLDGTEHARHREPFAAAFRPGLVEEQFAANVQQTAATLVDGLLAAGEAELRTQLAGPLAVLVIRDVLGLDDVDPDSMLAWYRAIVASVSAVTAGLPVTPEGTSAFADLRRAVESVIARSETSFLAEVGSAGKLTTGEIVSNSAIVMFGAIETSEGMTANAFHHLLTTPGLLPAVLADHTLIAPLVEESLRLEPAAAVVDRYATTSVELGGASINSGDFVSVSLAGANRDPAEFPDPDSVNIHRTNLRQHLAFVRGPHACLGAHLARIETISAVTAMVTALPGIDLVPERSVAPTGLVFRKSASVTARW